MSTQGVTTYRIACDNAGCDNATEPRASTSLADEAAIEAGWDLCQRQGRDLCPDHVSTPCLCPEEREEQDRGPHLVYTECSGRVFSDGKHRGYVTDFIKDGPHVVGAFAAIPPRHHESGEPVRMLHVTLGKTVGDDLREVVGTRFIDRDEFDRMTELDTLRHDLGWRA